MSISIVCACGKKLKAPDDAVGRKAKCPACGNQVTVPPPIIELVEERQPFWKDPIVLFGAAIPAVILFGFLGYLLLGRSSNGSIEQGRAPKSETVQVRSVDAPRKIPVEVSYPIVEDQTERTKRNVRVRLNMKVTEEILREIALEVKAQERRQFERTFIFYEVPSHLPVNDPSPWASTHFNPTLKVEIMGLSIDQEAKLRSLKLSPAGKVIGKWIVDRYLSNDVEVIHDDGGVKISRYGLDGEPWATELFEIPVESGRTFKRNEDGQPAGWDIYHIDKDGYLLVSDPDGLLYAGSPLK